MTLQSYLIESCISFSFKRRYHKDNAIHKDIIFHIVDDLYIKSLERKINDELLSNLSQEGSDFEFVKDPATEGKYAQEY